jgi:hypothetical protein
MVNEAFDRKCRCSEASLNGFCISLDCFASLAMTPEAMLQYRRNDFEINSRQKDVQKILGFFGNEPVSVQPSPCPLFKGGAVEGGGGLLKCWRSRRGFVPLEGEGLRKE